jgi:hypothetical protein
VARYSSNALNVSGAVLGGIWVEAMDKKEIAEFIPYKLAWVGPRRARGRVKLRFSFKTAPVSANQPG